MGLRLFGVLLHVALGVLFVELLYPLLRRDARMATRAWWCGRMLTLLGVRLRLSGPIPFGCHLIASNHVSWLDVFAIGAMFPCWFVSKAEIRAWPLAGRLAAANDTLFLRRWSPRAAYRMNAQIRARLASRQSVVVFPEGTTTDGTRVLPFYGALFQPAADGRHRVLPMAVCYRDRAGHRATFAAFIDEEPLWKSLRAVLDAPGIEAHLVLDDAIMAARRGELAERACAAVARLHRRGPAESAEAEREGRVSPALNPG